MIKGTRQTKKLISETDLLMLSRKVVGRYVNAGTIPIKDKDDVEMALVEKFLVKQNKISKAFEGKSKITTYCISILNRMCCEIIRKELKHWKNSNEEVPDISADKPLNNSNSTVINDEIQYLHKILLLFNDDFYKLKIFLAFFFQLKVRRSDIMRYTERAELATYFKENKEKSKGELFEQLAKIVNINEGKNLKPDAVRMWLNKCIDSIILKLNGPFNRAWYDKETLQILFEYYYLNLPEVELRIKKGA